MYPPNKEHQAFHWLAGSQDVQELIMHSYTHLDLKFPCYLGTLLRRLSIRGRVVVGGGSPNAQHFSACFDFLTQLECTQKLKFVTPLVPKCSFIWLKPSWGTVIMRSLWQFRFGKTNKMLWPVYIFTSHIQTYHNGQPTFVCWFHISSTIRKDNFIPLLSDWFTVAPEP